MDDMNITSAQYMIDNEAIQATIDGQEIFVPISEGNRHFDEIMRQVEAGSLTIQPAE
jgi:hypothetical protein